MTESTSRELVWYNEWDREIAAWLRQLVADGRLPHGEVSEQDVEKLDPEDIPSGIPCHFFAGIGGWPLALEMSGFPDDIPVWTGSCPCQPFSAAGRRRGEEDKRHVFPAWSELIGVHRPPVVFGEQVSWDLAIDWMHGVRASLERHDYAVAWAVLPASGVGSPQARHRLFWVADAVDHPSLASRKGLEEEAAVEGTADDLPRTPWTESRWVDCRHDDGRWRRIPATDTGVSLMDYGLPAKLVRLATHGVGNAIVPQVAAMFIRSWMETRGVSPARALSLAAS